MKIKKNITTVLFDLDGVIIHSNEIILHSWRAAAEKYHYTITDEMAGKFIIGASPEYTLDNLFPNEDRQTKLAMHNIVNQLEEESDYSLIPGVDSFLNQLGNYHVKIGLVTGSWPEKINNVLRKNLLNMFTHIVSRNDVIKGKPFAEPYCVAIRFYNSNPKETLVFEDSANVIQSALSAGDECIAIGNNIQLGKAIHRVCDFRYLEITNNDPDYHFNDSDFGIKILNNSKT